MEQNVNLRENTLMMLATVPEVKEKASAAGLYASYVPVVNAIEILNGDKSVGMTFNGRTIKVNGQYYNLDKWLIMYKITQSILNRFKPFQNE